MRISALIFIVSLTGCASGPLSPKSDLESSSQQQGNLIACSGYKAWPDCFKAAKQMCPQGYTELSKDENLPTQTRTLRISCN
jgi:hypothetical protein